MPDLFIGNATKQNMVFAYAVRRETGDMHVRSQPIPVGQQVKIAGDLSSDDIDWIIKQHAKYGLVAADTIDKARAFHGTCYSIGKPITAARLTYMIEYNMSKLVDQGIEIRRTNAVAQNNNVIRALDEAGRQESLNALRITVQQERADPNNSVPQMAEGLIVTDNMSMNPNAPPAQPAVGKKRATPTGRRAA